MTDISIWLSFHLLSAKRSGSPSQVVSPGSYQTQATERRHHNSTKRSAKENACPSFVKTLKIQFTSENTQPRTLSIFGHMYTYCCVYVRMYCMYCMYCILYLLCVLETLPPAKQCPRIHSSQWQQTFPVKTPLPNLQ